MKEYKQWTLERTVEGFLNWLEEQEKLREGELRKLYGVNNDKVG